MNLNARLNSLIAVCCITTSGAFVCTNVTAALAQSESEVSLVRASRTVYQVSGWQNSLVNRSPNLGRYYWNPMTRTEQVTTTQRTGKGALHSEAPPASVRHYVKPKSAPLPPNPNIRLGTVTATRMHREPPAAQPPASRSYTAESCNGILSYGGSEANPSCRARRLENVSPDLSVNARLLNRQN